MAWRCCLIHFILHKYTSLCNSEKLNECTKWLMPEAFPIKEEPHRSESVHDVAEMTAPPCWFPPAVPSEGDVSETTRYTGVLCVPVCWTAAGLECPLGSNRESVAPVSPRARWVRSSVTFPGPFLPWIHEFLSCASEVCPWVHARRPRSPGFRWEAGDSPGTPTASCGACGVDRTNRA